MRWLPTLIFSSSSSSSSSATSPSTRKSSSASSSSPSSASSEPSDSRKSSRGTWFFGNGKKSTRSRKLRHVDDDQVQYDVVSTAPIQRSPSARSYIRSNTSSSVAPQPLPLPESPGGLLRQRDADCRLPSPLPKEASGRVTESDVNVGVGSLPVGFKMRR